MTPREDWVPVPATKRAWKNGPHPGEGRWVGVCDYHADAISNGHHDRYDGRLYELVHPEACVFLHLETGE